MFIFFTVISCQQGTVQDGDVSIMIYHEFTCYMLGLLVYVNMTLTVDYYIVLLFIYTDSYILSTSTMMGYFSRTMYCYWVQVAQHWFEKHSQDFL